jgi:hypothetical protein
MLLGAFAKRGSDSRVHDRLPNAALVGHVTNSGHYDWIYALIA